MQIVMDVNGLQAQGYFVYASRSPETSGFAPLSLSPRSHRASASLAAKTVGGRPEFKSMRRTFRTPLGSRLSPDFYENADVFRWRLPLMDSISALLMRPLNGPLLTDRFSQCPC